MKVIDRGHVYDLFALDNDKGQPPPSLVFVKREGPGYPGNVGHHYGTNIQDVLRACIDRVQYLDNQIPHFTNTHVIKHLRAALENLEMRAAMRHGRSIYDMPPGDIEKCAFCSKCGHIGCDGTCHSGK